MAQNNKKRGRPLAIVLVLVVMISLIPLTLAQATPTWVEVGNLAQLRTALESATVTHVRFTNDIQLDTRGIIVNQNKQVLVVDGGGHTLRDANSNARSASIQLSRSGTLNNITFQNMDIAGRNKLGVATVVNGAAFRNVVLIFDNVSYVGPQLTTALDSQVVLRDSSFRIVPGHCNSVGEVVEATHITLEGDVDISKSANTSNDMFVITGIGGGLTVAPGAVVTVSNELTTALSLKTGFIRFSKANGYMRFDNDSYFEYFGSRSFMFGVGVREVRVGERAEVNVETRGNFLCSNTVFNIKNGTMVVDEGAILRLIALNNTKKEAIIELDKSSSITFNNPEEVFIFNSSTNKHNKTGLAIGAKHCGKVIDLSYVDISSLEYWNMNARPHTNLGAPTFDWRNADASSFSAFASFSKSRTTSVRTTGYTGIVPFNATTARTTNINVIRIAGAVPSHSVTFVDWDGTVLKEEIVSHGGAATAPENPAREGHTFTGWDPSDFSSVTSDLVVTAQYRIIVYTVRFVPNGGTPVPEPLIQNIDHGQKAVEPPPMTLLDLVFEGWYEDPNFGGEAWDFDTAITRNMVLHARWGWDAEGRITYLPGVNGSGGSVSTPAVSSVYIVKSAEEALVQRDGFILASWNASADGSGRTYAIGEEITITTGLQITLHAIWARDFGGSSAVIDIMDTEDDYEPDAIDVEADICTEDADSGGDEVEALDETVDVADEEGAEGNQPE